MLGSLGATATSPIETVPSWSNWFSKVMPLLVVFRRPPLAEATHHVVGSFSLTVIAVMRPPVLAGPMLRHWKALIQSSGIEGFAASAVGLAGSGWARGGGSCVVGPRAARDVKRQAAARARKMERASARTPGRRFFISMYPQQV